MTDVLNTPVDVVAAALAADNVIVALYFTLLFVLASPGPIMAPMSNRFKQANDGTIEFPSTDTPAVATSSNESLTFVIEGTDSPTSIPDEAMVMQNITIPKDKRMPITLSSSYQAKNDVSLSNISLSLTLALMLYSLSHLLATYSFPGASPVLLVSVFAIVIATVFSKYMSQLSQSGGIIGVLFMQVGHNHINTSSHLSYQLTR